MTRKKLVVGISAFLVVVLLLAGYAVIAAEMGSTSDPLVSLSYLNDELTTSIMNQLNATIDSKKAEIETSLDGKVTEYEAQLEAKVKELEDKYASSANNEELITAITNKVIEAMGNSTSSVSTYQKVTVEKGKTLIGKIGTEIVLRLGSATCVTGGGSPGLIDLTDGADLSNGKELVKNHAYLITVDYNRGFVATADCTVFVRGDYTIQ